MRPNIKGDHTKSKTSCELVRTAGNQSYSSPYVQLVEKLQSVGPLNIPDLNEFLVKAKIDFLNLYNDDSISDFKISDFELIRVLGYGGFGKVILAELKKDETIYAIKVINKRFVIESRNFHRVFNEKRILQSINFPFVVYLKHFFVDFNYLYYAMPFISSGDFYDFLQKYQPLSEPHARFYMSQLVLALEYLHYLDLIHRDLKPENIMIDIFGYIKVCDFGLCIRCSGNNRVWTVLGNEDYMAPEYLEEKGYDCAINWWASGVILYQMCAGHRSFSTRSISKMSTQKWAYKIPDSFNNELVSLIKKHLIKVPSKRLGNSKKGANNIKTHSWFKTTDWYKILNRTIAAPFLL